MRRVTALAAAVVMVGGGCSAEAGGGGAVAAPPAERAAAGPGTPRYLVRGLRVTWGLAFLPDGDALVTERDSARLLRVTPRGTVSQVGVVPGVVPQGEAGLLGVAVSPSFAEDRRVYLYLSARSDNRIVRARYDGRGLGRPEVLVEGIPKAGRHNGGRLAFGPDGMLYASTGDAGVTSHAQDRGSLGGKILRMTPDGQAAPGNPFGTLVWSWGHRNVQGLAWDEAKRLYATEFGQDRFDEINLIEKGKNYGWPEVEGTGDDEDFANPLLTWAPAEASPSGLAYADGSLWAAALRGQRLWQVPVRDGRVGQALPHFAERFGRIRSATRSPDGRSLWLTTDTRSDDGVIVVPLS
ncbi:PQQ-dependent sugar dehydrogenase [Actinomadura kijaniata]|uniref:PQQ-dependent sugar dehydrogenase n=1 Tax=Actinomadura kijaniata TaxID=46161 RepID=UPI0008321542|nr:PQQ-dependent sugar dehydrogenase [Actinomadura kijaniata]